LNNSTQPPVNKNTAGNGTAEKVLPAILLDALTLVPVFEFAVLRFFVIDALAGAGAPKSRRQLGSSVVKPDVANPCRRPALSAFLRKLNLATDVAHTSTAGGH
jgi:hypothetical protein